MSRECCNDRKTHGYGTLAAVEDAWRRHEHAAQLLEVRPAQTASGRETQQKDPSVGL
jgi:hypothetical protein